jgi:toxin HigB-1
MNIEFRNDDLRAMVYDPNFTGGFSREVIKAYRMRIQYIRSALDERDFYAMKSLHYEKLKGKRRNERSMRLNDKYRLVLRTKINGANRTIVVLSIEDYH